MEKRALLSDGKIYIIAKLVELIYSSERNLLKQFIREADDSGNGNGHTAAAKRIAEGFSEKTGKNKEELETFPIENIRNIAKMLFAESGSERLRPHFFQI